MARSSMSSEVPYARLPTPVARLVRMALQTRETKKKHDYIFMAWDVSVRLLVAANPPRDTAKLTSPSLGTWVQATTLPQASSQANELRELVLFLAATVERAIPPSQRKTSARDLLLLLPEYRNKATGAHSGPRSDSFYTQAFPLLARALPIAWEEGFFLPSGAQLIYVSDVELDATGEHLARTFLLEGAQSSPESEGVSVPPEVLPQRVYLRQKSTYRSLYPWVVFQADDVREQFLLFNASNRGLTYLDCDTGVLLNHEALRRAGIMVEDPTSDRSEHASAEAPVPAELVEQTPTTTQDDKASSALGSPKNRSVQVALLGAALASALLMGAAWPRRSLAPSDWFFHDTSGGEGWLERCQNHEISGQSKGAIPACEKALLSSAKGSSTRSKVTAQLAKMQCADKGIPRLAHGSLGLDMLVASMKEPLLEQDPKKPGFETLKLSSATCVEIGSPSVTSEKKIWFHVSLPDTLNRGKKDWYAPASAIERNDAPELLSKCIFARQNGLVESVLSWCREALKTSRVDIFARATLALGEIHAMEGNLAESIGWHLSAAMSYPVGSSERAAIGKTLAVLCERSNLFDRPTGDPRTFKVVSWHWFNRRLDFVKELPGGKPVPEKQSVGRGTCVLTTGNKGDGGGSFWLEVDIPLNDFPYTHGWMPAGWLEP